MGRKRKEVGENSNQPESKKAKKKVVSSKTSQRKTSRATTRKNNKKEVPTATKKISSSTQTSDGEIILTNDDNGSQDNQHQEEQRQSDIPLYTEDEASKDDNYNIEDPQNENEDPDERGISSQEKQRRNVQVNDWVNSTPTVVNKPRVISIVNNPNDVIVRMTDAIEKTLLAVRENSNIEGNSRLANRMTTAKRLPTFSGNPLEWIYFKESYDLSTELGGYSSRENIARLFDALKGDARQSVSTLLATCHDPSIIMQTLELQYGNKKFIAENILNDLRTLPDLDSRKINLTQFATRVKNSVEALRSLKMTNYLLDPNLIVLLGNKLPTALKYAYSRYVVYERSNETDVEKLASFLYQEAEMAIAGGIFDSKLYFSSKTKSESSRRHTEISRMGSSHTVTHESSHITSRPIFENDFCVYCNRKNHTIDRCSSFANENFDRRWILVKNFKLCFNCLGSNHIRENCKRPSCPECKKGHHKLLHKYTRNFQRKSNLIHESNKEQPSTLETNKTLNDLNSSNL